MSEEVRQLESAIHALEAQRALLGDAVVDTAVGPLRARLAALATPHPVAPEDQSLRQVSILFLDMVGSTALSQHLDPEQIHGVMDGALARATAIVQAHQGKVLQYAGDNLLAGFGAEAAREDDAEQAVRCGLALLELGRALGDTVHRQHRHAGFNVRVGIHTGAVLLGGGVDAAGTIRGIAVNVAARMEQTAPAGTLRISHDTQALVRGLFEVLPQPPLLIKGVDTPIQSYLVQRPKPRALLSANRGIEGVVTRMVGRELEFEKLQDACKRLIGQPAGVQLLMVVADAGLGKSRLLHEFRNWVQAQAWPTALFQARALPQTRSQPYGLLRDILGRWLELDESEGPDAARHRLEQAMARLFAADEGQDLAQAHAHVLGHLVGLDHADSQHVRGILEDPRQIRNRGFHTAAQIMRRVAARDQAPVVLLLDDLHWADEGSLDFLDYLAQVSRDLPLLMLCLTRPELYERRPGWSSADGRRVRIALAPLASGHSSELANELLKKLPEIPATLRDLVACGAEGNPFYMEELVKMLMDEGAIAVDAQRWTVVPEKLVLAHVPQTLTGVLQARLDSLHATEKLALQQAAVIGFVFWEQTLAAIDVHAVAALPGVTQRELVVQHGLASLGEMREFSFKHQILHQVVYDTVLRQARREYHAKTAAWLAGIGSARAGDFLGVTAEHYEKAGDLAGACEFFTRAAEHARERDAHQEALDHTARAFALLGQDLCPDHPQMRWRLHDVREQILDLQGRRAEQQADIAALEQQAEVLNNDRLRATAALRRAGLAFRLGDYLMQQVVARQALALAERADCLESRLSAHRLLVNAMINLGEDLAARELAQQGLETARAHGLRRVEARFLNSLALTLGRQDDLAGMLPLDQQVLQIYRDLGDRTGEASALHSVGISWLSLGQLAQAQQFLQQSLRLMRALGNRSGEPYPLSGLSQLALWQGEDALALAHAQTAVDLAIEVQATRCAANALCSLGYAELAFGRHAAAVAAFERAGAMPLPANDAQQFDFAAGLARVALDQGQAQQALRIMQGALEHLTEGGALVGTDRPHLIRWTCCQALQAVNDPRAADMLAATHSELMGRTATITDSVLRHSFLANIPENREIVAAWRAQQLLSM